MPRNGVGVYNLPATTWNPATTGTTIESSGWNTTGTDLAAALTQSVSKDGQTPMTGNLPMGNNKLTGLADGSSATDSATYGQTLHTTGTQTLTGDLIINGSLSLSGSLNVNGAAIFTQTVTAGNLSVTSAATIGSLTASGFQLISSDTASTAAPDLVIARNFSQTTGGKLGRVLWRGLNTSSTTTTFADMPSRVVTATSGNEAGEILLRTVLSGAVDERFAVGGGIYAKGLTDKGPGTINATGFYLNGTLTTTTFYNGSYITNADLTGAIPIDDTAPLIGEGTQIISVSVPVPTATAKVHVWTTGQFVWNASQQGVAALFMDSTCLDAVVGINFAAANYGILPLAWEGVPGSAATFTFSMRVGASSGAMRANGTLAGRLFGGKAAVWMFIRVSEVT